MNAKISNYLNQLNLDPRKERAIINIIKAVEAQAHGYSGEVVAGNIFDVHIGDDANANLEAISELNGRTNYTCLLTLPEVYAIGSYFNGVITAFVDNHIEQYNVSFNDGTVTKLSSFDQNLVMLDLERVSPESDSDTTEIIATRALNLEKLQRTLTLPFLAQMDYGIGVGRFINGNGGEINVTYATGGNGHYTIGVDGSIEKDIDYVPENTYAWQAYRNAGGNLDEGNFYAELANLIG